MKNSLSSTPPPRRKFLLRLLFLTLFIIPTSSTNLPETSLHHPHHHGLHDHHCATATISTPKHQRPHPPCLQSQILYPRRPPLPPLPQQHLQPPPPPPEEIDPRYGVAKRLVPSGPNPLHN
ncbi:hypothetical protein L2E82_13673 [Cichorium intybus]|uniref:Uncharacterized protein n=1 Tax=Cichorium intybus TaxID=13427 RepID=A0ACB9EXK3_CICIN|nr:hypothetical protein L2E82_13673 [Cichorium intybus]